MKYPANLEDVRQLLRSIPDASKESSAGLELERPRAIAKAVLHLGLERRELAELCKIRSEQLASTPAPTGRPPKPTKVAAELHRFLRAAGMPAKEAARQMKMLGLAVPRTLQRRSASGKTSR